jgi:hypothetical protein
MRGEAPKRNYLMMRWLLSFVFKHLTALHKFQNRAFVFLHLTALVVEFAVYM